MPLVHSVLRGEALASVASISNVTLTTSCDGLSAHSYRVEGGQTVDSKKAIEIKGRHLKRGSFFQCSCKKKVSSHSLFTLTQEVIKAVKGLALGHPGGFIFTYK